MKGPVLNKQVMCAKPLEDSHIAACSVSRKRAAPMKEAFLEKSVSHKSKTLNLVKYPFP